jgi:hypothetical protein
MRVIVCGGLHYADRVIVFHTLDRLHAGRPITMLVHGGATGADDLAFPVTKEEWTRLGKEAGPLRNKRMMDSGDDLVVAFPGERETADMVGNARRAGVRACKC